MEITLKKLTELNKFMPVARLLVNAGYGFKAYRSILKRMERGSPELTVAESRAIAKAIKKLKSLLS